MLQNILQHNLYAVLLLVHKFVSKMVESRVNWHSPEHVLFV